jgi:copper homeostasis protein (lipoprotein)
MNRPLLCVALLAALAATACKPQAPAESEPAAQANTAAEAPAPVAAAPAAAPSEVAFDTKGFAGTFATGDSKITLNADGSYKLAGATQGDGTWTAEENGKRIRLDPNSKAEADRIFIVTSRDQLDQVDEAGAAVTPAQTFQREAAAQ